MFPLVPNWKVRLGFKKGSVRFTGLPKGPMAHKHTKVRNPVLEPECHFFCSQLISPVYFSTISDIFSRVHMVTSDKRVRKPVLSMRFQYSLILHYPIVSKCLFLCTLFFQLSLSVMHFQMFCKKRLCNYQMPFFCKRIEIA